MAAALVLGIAALATGLQSAASSERAVERTRHRPVEHASRGYVSSRQCRSCHPAQYRSWHRSYHRTMTQPATADNVQGDFGGVELEHMGGHYLLDRDADGFAVTIEPADSATMRSGDNTGTFPIVLVTGSHHMQVYWYETGHDRTLGQLPFVFLAREKRWIPRIDAFLRPPTRAPMPEQGRWNTDCITCHTTYGQPRRDDEGGFDSRVGELGIACEACHGPGLEHVRRESSPLQRYIGHVGGSAPGDIVQPASLDHERASQICSQCHSIWLHRDAEAERRWNRRGASYRPGQDAEDSRLLFQPSQRGDSTRLAELVQENPDYVRGQFWPDGMARTSGREFNGMIDSPCYQRGELSCLSCHQMHTDATTPDGLDAWADDQLAEAMDGDHACLQCHDELEGRIQAHTHHAAGSSGSRCYNCHMPYTSYALMKAMRSHQISTPDVLTTLHTGRPNACNLCHLDRPLGWTADHLKRWYGTALPPLGDDQQTLSSAVTWALRGDPAQRVLIASALGWEPARRASAGEDWVAPLLGLLMDDPYATVRYVAERSLRSLGAFADFDYAYDFVVPPTQRDPVFETVRDYWQSHRPSEAALPPSVAVGADGLDMATVERMLQHRDQRDITILE